MTDNLAVVALLISMASLIVAIASIVLANKAMKQAKQAATLDPRTEAINHLGIALADINDYGFVTRATVNSIREAMQISKRVFSRDIGDRCYQAYATAHRLEMPANRQTDQDAEDIHALARDMQTLIDQMNQKATLGG